MRSPPRMATLATALASVLIGTSNAAGEPTPRSVHYGPLTGTVIEVDPSARTFELLTGVGHALRVTHVHVPAELGILAQGTRTSLSALTHGCIVRVECKAAKTRTEATSVELLHSPRPSSP